MIDNEPDRIEYRAATTGAGIIDSSEKGRLHFCGSEHLEFLHRLSTNDTLHCAVGAGMRTVFCDPRGRIVEVLELCRINSDLTEGFTTVNGAAALIEWLGRYHFSEQIEWRDNSDDLEQCEIVGAQAVQMCADVLAIDAAGVPRFSLLQHSSFGAMRIEAGRHPGIRLWGPDLTAPRKALVDAGAVAIRPVTQEQLRIHWGEPGTTELTLEHNPWEAGLGDAIHMAKGCYTGQEVIARLDAYQKVKQHLVGLRLAAPVPSGAVVSVAGTTVGTVTSIAIDPELGTLALAYVRTAHCHEGTPVEIHSDMGAPVHAVVSNLPFVTP